MQLTLPLLHVLPCLRPPQVDTCTDSLCIHNSLNLQGTPLPGYLVNQGKIIDSCYLPQQCFGPYSDIHYQYGYTSFLWIKHLYSCSGFLMQILAVEEEEGGGLRHAMAIPMWQTIFFSIKGMGELRRWMVSPHPFHHPRLDHAVLSFQLLHSNTCNSMHHMKWSQNLQMINLNFICTPGVVGTEFCYAESPPMIDPALWTFVTAVHTETQ